MKNLTLADGTSLSMADNSTVGTFVFTVSAFEEVDELKAKLTSDNLESVIVGTVPFSNVVVDKVNVTTDDNGKITARFLNRMSTSDIVNDAIDSYTAELLEGGVI